MNGGVAIVRRGRPRTASGAGSRPATSTSSPTTSTTPSRGPRPPGPTGSRCRSACWATPPRCCPAWSAMDAPGRHRHRPDARPRPAQLRPRRPVARRGRASCGRRDPGGYTDRARDSMAAPLRGDGRLRRPRRRGVRLRQQPAARRPSSGGSSGPSTTPASCPPTSARCSARARARSGGRRCPATRPTSAPPTGPCSTSSPTNEALARWIRLAVGPGGVPGPARPHLLARLRRARPDGPAVQRAGGQRARCRRRSSSGATTSTRARWRRPTARPRRCATAPTPSPTGRCSTPCSTPPAGPAGSRSTTAAASASAGRSTPGWWSWPTAPTSPPRSSSGCSPTTPARGVARHADAGYPEALRVARDDRAAAADAAVTPPTGPRGPCCPTALAPGVVVDCGEDGRIAAVRAGVGRPPPGAVVARRAGGRAAAGAGRRPLPRLPPGAAGAGRGPATSGRGGPRCTGWPTGSTPTRCWRSPPPPSASWCWPGSPPSTSSTTCTTPPAWTTPSARRPGGPASGWCCSTPATCGPGSTARRSTPCSGGSATATSSAGRHGPSGSRRPTPT